MMEEENQPQPTGQPQEENQEQGQTSPLPENRIDLSGLKAAVDEVKKEIGEVIVGQQKLIELMIIALLADGHVLIEGVPGIAKTLSARLMAHTIRAGFSRIQFTPDLMPSDILGTSVFNFKDSTFNFKEGPIFAHIILIDEVNRAPAKTQAALFEVMEEHQITIDGKTYKMEDPFMVLATQNPIEQEGTYRLPEAQLDRFLFKIEVTYPTFDEEVSILSYFNRKEHMLDVMKVRQVLDREKISEYREKILDIHIEDKLLDYIARIVNQTREHKDLYLGASPRASLAIMRTAKVYAAINGRDFVTPDDIRYVALPVMIHRIILTPEKEMEGGIPREVVKNIIDEVEVPR